MGYDDAIRCKCCGKIYWNIPCDIPKYCKKCGNKISNPKVWGDGIITAYRHYTTLEEDNIEHIVAKKILFLWIVRRNEEG